MLAYARGAARVVQRAKTTYFRVKVSESTRWAYVCSSLRVGAQGDDRLMFVCAMDDQVRCDRCSGCEWAGEELQSEVSCNRARRSLQRRRRIRAC